MKKVKKRYGIALMIWCAFFALVSIYGIATAKNNIFLIVNSIMLGIDITVFIITGALLSGAECALFEEERTPKLNGGRSEEEEAELASLLKSEPNYIKTATVTCCADGTECVSIKSEIITEKKEG